LKEKSQFVIFVCDVVFHGILFIAQVDELGVVPALGT
jgi:hypothetical protein